MVSDLVYIDLKSMFFIHFLFLILLVIYFIQDFSIFRGSPLNTELVTHLSCTFFLKRDPTLLRSLFAPFDKCVLGNILGVEDAEINKVDKVPVSWSLNFKAWAGRAGDRRMTKTNTYQVVIVTGREMESGGRQQWWWLLL